MRQTVTLLVLLLLAGIAAAQPMSGTYTVKADGTGDFLNPYLAGEAVRTRGAVGDVTFDIYSGVYVIPGYIYLYQVPGSDTCDITFRAATGQSVTIENNSGYAFYGYATNNVRIENLRLVTSSYGIYLNGCDNWRVTGNTIRSGSDCIRIYFNTIGGSSNNNVFERNDLKTSSNYGIYHYGSSTYRHQHNQFINNIINGWTSYGVYSYYNDGALFYYNTFYGTGSFTFYAYYTAGDTWKNNVVVGFYPMYRATGSSNFPAFSNYNCWYASSGSSQQFYNLTYGYQSLTQWQTNSGGLDMNSITSNPLTGGVNNPRLKTGSPCIAAANPISGITVDIDGDTRDGSTPDIGADEYTSVGSAMSGIYYIKPGILAADTFPSFEVANGQLALRGQSGDITFEVFAGTYNEQVWVEFDQTANWINYLAHLNTGVPEDVTINNRNPVYVNGMKRIRFRHLNLNYTNYGIYLNNNASVSPWRTIDTLVIQGCNISGTGSFGIYGWLANANWGSAEDSIYNNTISGGSYGIYIYGSGSYYTNRMYIFNNFISGFSSYGVYLYYHRGTKLLFNTIVNFSSSASRCVQDYYGYHGTGANDSCVVKGNIFYNGYNSTAAYAYYKYLGNITPSLFNNNCYYVPNNSMGYVAYSSSYGSSTWSGWQALGFDPNGINQNPQVGGPLNLHLRTGSPCINAGPAGTGIAFDIDGDTRTTPDIGADEYTSVGSPMSGIFTIKQQGGGDYLTFAQAFGDVQLRGFGGNVQFDVYDG
ncbi:MAG: right-handed parallel beta-helix repeat-containing protein, partial [bacterium]